LSRRLLPGARLYIQRVPHYRRRSTTRLLLLYTAAAAAAERATSVSVARDPRRSGFVRGGGRTQFKLGNNGGDALGRQRYTLRRPTQSIELGPPAPPEKAKPTGKV